MQHFSMLPMLAVTILSLIQTGCADEDAEAFEADARAVYVCTETRDAIVIAVQKTPAVNPATGRRTLMPGLYCPKCEKWYPSPPLEVLQRTPGAAACPKNGTPLSADGPLPE